MIIKLANHYIEIKNLYSFIEDYCSDYLIRDTEKPRKKAKLFAAKTLKCNCRLHKFKVWLVECNSEK